jgi:4-hydroxybenzoate polyprenyltransferase
MVRRGSVPPRGHPAGALGIVHPFPTVLVSLVTIALASLAGGSAPDIALLGGAMLGFQSSIGATNDLADREEDGRRGAAKPIPAGQIGLPAAMLVALVGAGLGLGLSALVGPGVALVGAIGLGCGIAYDLWLRPRGLEALAYAVALPVLLVYAWWGASGALPPGGLALVALAALLGPGLYVSNALVDVDDDTRERTTVLTARLGRGASVTLLAVLVVTTHLLAWSLWLSTERPLVPALAMITGGALGMAGVGLSADRRRGARSLGWTAQALATALLGVGLLAALADGSATR